MADRGGDELDVAVVVAGEGVIEVDRHAVGGVGGEAEDALFAATAARVADVEGGDRSGPVDAGMRAGVDGVDSVFYERSVESVRFKNVRVRTVPGGFVRGHPRGRAACGAGGRRSGLYRTAGAPRRAGLILLAFAPSDV